MKVLENTIWPIFGGLDVVLEYFISLLMLMATIIDIPFGITMMKPGILALWPLGSRVIDRPRDGGCVNVFMNVLWFLTGGIWIALMYLGFGLPLGITTIGMPWAKMHFRLTRLVLTPFRRQAVDDNFQVQGLLGRPIVQMSGIRHRRKMRYEMLVVHNHLG